MDRSVWPQLPTMHKPPFSGHLIRPERWPSRLIGLGQRFVMSPVLAISFLLAAGAVCAQTARALPEPLAFGAALEHALDHSAAVLTARTNLVAAERELRRTKSDPLALRLDKLRARQGVDNARALFEVASLDARAEVAAAFFAALRADEALQLAQSRQALGAAVQHATRVRYELGAVTALELTTAENNLVATGRALQDALLNQKLAYQNLNSLLGGGVSSLSAFEGEPPTLDPSAALREARTKNAQFIAARWALNVAQVEFDTLNNAFSAPVDVEAAQDALANAKTLSSEVRRALEIAVQGACNGLLATYDRWQNEQANYQTSLENMRLQQVRFEAGTLAPITFQQAELAHLETRAALRSVLYDVWLARAGLDQVVAGEQPAP